MRTSPQSRSMHQHISQLRHPAPTPLIRITSHDFDNKDDDIAEKPASTVTPQIVRGLKKHLFKQLLLDIEASGGLSENFQLKHICDQKPTVYSVPTSKIRRQVQNRVNRLKKFSATDYQQYLNVFGILSAHQTNFLRSPAEANDQAQDQVLETHRFPPLPSPSIMSAPHRGRMSTNGTQLDSPSVFRSSHHSTSIQGRLEMNSQGSYEGESVPPPKEQHVGSM
jgi:hypothetical protein